MKDLFIFLIIAAISYGMGKLLLNLFANKISKLENFIFATGLGLAILGYSIFIMGSAGFLYLKYVLALLILYSTIAFYNFYKLIRSVNLKSIIDSLITLSSFEKFLIGVSVFIPLVCYFGAIAPATGNDTLAYHLYHAKIFVQNHKIAYIPFSRESMWPYLTEMLYTLGLIFKSTGVSTLFHYFFGILSSLAVFAFAYRLFDRRTAILACALFTTAPGIFMQAVDAYVDLSLCFYSFVALYTLILWYKEKTINLLFLSAIFTGLALSIKIIGGITFVALAAIILFISINNKYSLKMFFKYFLVFSLTAFAVCGAWYIRSYIVLHNPVYPFLHNIFGSGWETNISEGVGIRNDVLGFIRLPWDLVMNLDSFGGQQIGVIFLAFLPFLIFIKIKEKVIQYLLTFLLLYAFLWFFAAQQMRFVFVDFAVVFILISAGFFRAYEKYNLQFLKILLAGCILFNVSLCVYYNRDAIRLKLGKINEEEYLNIKERTYPVAQYVNKNLPENSVLIAVGEPRGFWFDRKMLFYDIWELSLGKDINEYIDSLHSQSIPVYLLYRSDAKPGPFKAVIAATPIFRLNREIDEKVHAEYFIFPF